MGFWTDIFLNEKEKLEYKVRLFYKLELIIN